MGVGCLPPRITGIGNRDAAPHRLCPPTGRFPVNRVTGAFPAEDLPTDESVTGPSPSPLRRKRQGRVLPTSHVAEGEARGTPRRSCVGKKPPPAACGFFY